MLLLLACATPMPAEVRALMPVPAGARVQDEGCVGIQGRTGHTCSLKADAVVGMEPGAAAAMAKMAGWTETSWDQVPGRIQASWVREDEHVMLAVHDVPPGSRWSLTYVRQPDQPEPEANVQECPEPVPALLAQRVLPPGAELMCGAHVEGAPNAWAAWAVTGEPEQIFATFTPAGPVTLRSRTRRSRALAWQEGDREFTVSLTARDDGRHRLMWSVHSAM